MFSQFNHGSLPDELSMKIMSYLSMSELVALSTVSKPTAAMVREVILANPVASLIEFIIFHPSIGFIFVDWLYKKEILPQILMKKPANDPWKVLLAVLLIENVKFLLQGNVRNELNAACLDETVSTSFKTSLKLSIDTMLNAMMQPFFFTGMPKTSQPTIFLNLKHAGFSFLGGEDFNFKYADLTDSFFDFTIMRSSDFSFAKLIRSSFREGEIETGDFSNGDLKGVAFISAKISGCKYINAQLFAAKFSHSYLTDNDFSCSGLEKSKFKFAQIQSCIFYNTDLIYSSFAYAKIKDTDFSKAKLHETIFQGAHLHGLKFVEAELFDIDFSSCIHEGRICGLNFTQAYLVRCNFTSQDLCDANFMTARFVSVNFTDTDLSGTDFFDATFINVNFTNCKTVGFEHKNGKFQIKENDFLHLSIDSQKDLNLGAILVLQFYLSRMIESKRPDNQAAIASLKLLISDIHLNLSEPLHNLIADWQDKIISNDLTCERALSRRHVFYSLTPNSFFEPIVVKNEIIDLIEKIADLSLSRQLQQLSFK